MLLRCSVAPLFPRRLAGPVTTSSWANSATRLQPRRWRCELLDGFAWRAEPLFQRQQWRNDFGEKAPKENSSVTPRSRRSDGPTTLTRAYDARRRGAASSNTERSPDKTSASPAFVLERVAPPRATSRRSRSSTLSGASQAEPSPLKKFDASHKWRFATSLF